MFNALRNAVGYGEVEQDTVAIAPALGIMVGAAIDAHALKEDFGVFDDLELDGEQAVMVEELEAFRQGIAQGTANELILEQLQHMQERIDVLAAGLDVTPHAIWHLLSHVKCVLYKTLQHQIFSFA